jgi:hypothetical protein
MLNFIKGWKTMIFNLSVIIVSLADYVDVINVIAPEYAPLFMLFVGFGNAVLRYFTDTPVGVAKVEEAPSEEIAENK